MPKILLVNDVAIVNKIMKKKLELEEGFLVDTALDGKEGISKAMTTPASHPRDPLHGITLESILNQLVQRHGWSEMGRRIPIRCFQFNPTVKSSLTFLRKTPWARQKVEDWFISELPPT